MKAAPYMSALTASALVALAASVGVITRSPVAASAVLAAAMAGHAYGRRAGHRDMAHRVRYAGEDLAALQESISRLVADQEFGRVIAEAAAEDPALLDDGGLTRDWGWRS